MNFLAAVAVALLPSAGTVAVSDTFTVKIRVTEAGSKFNAYQTIVQFDPEKVTFLPLSPTSLQEGPYMTGACGNTFHWFQAGTYELGVVHSLLCAGVELPGPGDLYVFRFRAEEMGTADFEFSMIEFANAGNPVTPVNGANSAVTITSGGGGSGCHGGCEVDKATETWAGVKGLYR